MSSSSGDEDSDSQSATYHPSNRLKIKPLPTNTFKNDGSFLEMFKKMQEQKTNSQSDTSDKKPGDGNDDVIQKSSSSKIMEPRGNAKIVVGKRRLGLVLPTGMVKKQRKDAKEETNKIETQQATKKGDPWSTYMAEVKKYKQQSCSDEDGSRRPLVK